MLEMMNFVGCLLLGLVRLVGWVVGLNQLLKWVQLWLEKRVEAASKVGATEANVICRTSQEETGHTFTSLNGNLPPDGAICRCGEMVLRWEVRYKAERRK